MTRALALAAAAVVLLGARAVSRWWADVLAADDGEVERWADR